MRELNPSEFATIDAMIDGLRLAYNAFEIEPYGFGGTPDDFAALDYIPYELPMEKQYADGSLAFAMAWGNVLAKSFGFSWVADDNLRNGESYALRHDDPNVLIFPFYRLLEITVSSGSQQTPAQTLWFETIQNQNDRTYVADGWHPVFDAAQCPEKIGCPSSTTEACRLLIDTVPDFTHRMSTYPYDYAKTKDWKQLEDYAKTIIESYV